MLDKSRYLAEEKIESKPVELKLLGLFDWTDEANDGILDLVYNEDMLLMMITVLIMIIPVMKEY